MSDDARELVYVSRNGAVKRLLVSGGTTQTLWDPSGQEVPVARVVSDWMDGVVLFATAAGVFKLTDTGGTPDEVVGPLGRWWLTPALLPDGDVLMSGTDGLQIIDVDGDVTLLIRDTVQAVYLRSGHVLYRAGRGLFVAPLDLRARRLDTPVPLMEPVQDIGGLRGFSASNSGIVAAAIGGGLPDFDARALDIVDLSSRGEGDSLQLSDDPKSSPVFSPNGRMVAFTKGELFSGEGQIWIVDIATSIERQLTFVGRNRREFAWSPGGDSIVFASTRQGSDSSDLYVIPVDNSRPAELLLSLPGDQEPHQWLDDGSIVYSSSPAPGGETHIFVFDPRSGEPIAFPDPLAPGGLEVSPDGSLIAFRSEFAGISGLWVREFPVPSGRYPVTENEGYNPRWSSDGTRLYSFTRTNGPDTLSVFTVDRGSGVSFRDQLVLHITEYRGWDLHPDGDRIVVARARELNFLFSQKIAVLINWDEVLK